MTEATLLEKLAWVIALILLIPVLVNPASWIVAVVLAVLVLAVYYGGRYLAGLEKQRRYGERGMVSDVRYSGGEEEK